MSSPNFDTCQLNFARTIGDAVATVATAGQILSVAERNTYINRALNELFRKYWEGVKGNSAQFIEIFPELLKNQAINTTAGGTYALAAANTYDFFKIVSGYKGTSIIKFLDKTLVATVVTSNNEQYIPSTSNLIAFEIQGTISFYPAASFNAQSVNIQYIRRPVDPSNGNPFTNGGTYDHPFNAVWNDEIINIATQLYLVDAQER